MLVLALYTEDMSKNFSSFQQKSRGFTLLELLVVISIIGLLIALGVASYTTAQQNGRDAKRRSDMKAVQSAFEQYYAVNGAYPDDAGCTPADPAITSVMPAGLPSDPKPGQTAYSFSCSTDAYCSCALLEKQDGGNAAAPSGTSCNLGTGSYFCVENLQ